MLEKIISGGQSGADVSGLRAAKKFGHETGGWLPKGCLTEHGPKPEYLEEFKMKEHSTQGYPARTFANAKDSDGTVRFAFNFDTAGEKCTLKAITQYKRPYFDVEINPTATGCSPAPQEFVDWILKNNIKILNVAGNRESTHPGLGQCVETYLLEVFAILAQG